MKHAAIAVFALLLAGAVPAPAQQTRKPAEIRGYGCVEAGIEARCLMVKDLRSGKLYNLLIKGMQPVVGEGIEFIGVLHKNPTTCMQGIPLDVKSWARSASLECKPAPAPEK